MRILPPGLVQVVINVSILIQDKPKLIHRKPNISVAKFLLAHNHELVAMEMLVLISRQSSWLTFNLVHKNCLLK